MIMRRALWLVASALAVGAHTSGGRMTSTESDLRALLEHRSEAIRAKDIDRLIVLYSPDIVYFDVVPPLEYTGAATLRARFAHWFEGWASPIGQEIRDVNIVASGDVAVAHMLIRASGTLKGGRKVDYWVRTSNSFRRSSDGWLITHEHVSLPVDFNTGSAAMNLEP